MSPPFNHSKRDNSLEDSEELPADEDSTQNNASSRSDILLESSNEKGDLHDLTSDDLSREVRGIDRERLVNVKDYRHFQQNEQMDSEERISEVLDQPVHNDHVKNRKNMHTSFNRGSMHSQELKRRDSPSPRKSILDKKIEHNQGPSPAKKLKSINSAKKTRQNGKQESEIPNQSMVQVSDKRKAH